MAREKARRLQVVKRGDDAGLVQQERVVAVGGWLG
jgi:hypothetical protein